MPKLSICCRSLGEGRESGHRTISGFRIPAFRLQDVDNVLGPSLLHRGFGDRAGSPLPRHRPRFFLTFRLVPARRNSLLGSETLLQPIGPVKRETPHIVSSIMTGWMPG